MRSIARSLVAAAMLPMAASHLGLIASNEPTKPDPNDPALTARGKVVSAGRTGVCYFGRRSHGRW
jgi:hypothetical protein